MGRRLLITAFSEFPGVPTNPTELLIADLATTSVGGMADFDTLKAEYDYCRNWVQRVDYAKYDLVVHLGFANASKSIRLETTAYNEASHTTPDNTGSVWTLGQLIRKGPAALNTPVKCHQILENLPRDVHRYVKISSDPGRYLCNFVYYFSLSLTSSIPTKIFFIHCPKFEFIERPMQAGILTMVLHGLVIHATNE